MSAQSARTFEARDFSQRLRQCQSLRWGVAGAGAEARTWPGAVTYISSRVSLRFHEYTESSLRYATHAASERVSSHLHELFSPNREGRQSGKEATRFSHSTGIRDSSRLTVIMWCKRVGGESLFSSIFVFERVFFLFYIFVRVCFLVACFIDLKWEPGLCILVR